MRKPVQVLSSGHVWVDLQLEKCRYNVYLSIKCRYNVYFGKSRYNVFVSLFIIVSVQPNLQLKWVTNGEHLGRVGQCEEGCNFQWLLNHLKRWLDGFCWSNLGEKRKAGSKLSQEWLPQKSGLRLQVFQGGLKMKQCSQFSILLSHWCREIHNLLVIQPEYSWITDHHHSPSCWESLCGCRPFILILIFGYLIFGCPPDISYWYLIFGYLANHLVFNIW